jgi:hypothetical protein
MITSKNPVSVSMPREGLACFYVSTRSKTEAGALIMGSRIEYQNGQKVGECIYLYELPRQYRDRYAMFRCSCGKEFPARISHVNALAIKTCRCCDENVWTKIIQHRQHRTKLYKVWCAMKQRCYNENDKAYKNYGGRGVAICEEWKNDFIAFRDYATDLPRYGEDGMSLDRYPNNDGNYEPGNVRWADKHAQGTNTRCRNNISGFTGVVFHKRAKRWVASIVVHRKVISLKTHKTPKEAAIARDQYIIDNKLWEYKLQVLDQPGR